MLNLCLPIYNFIFAFGSMIGLGSATRYAILKAQNDERAHRYFSNGLMCAILIAVPFMLVGVLSGCGAPVDGRRCSHCGAGPAVYPASSCCSRRSSCATTSFRPLPGNDGDPSLAMVATLSGSLFNVVFDYIFIFPMGWGLPGAALATAISPVISISICSLHFRKPTNGVQFVRQRPSVRLLLQSCQLGISGFVGEMSSAVTTTVFNLLLLRLAGNVAVAAYGVVANFALVATAIFNGVSQGAQPLVSQCYGKRDRAGVRKLLGLGSGTALALAAALYLVVFGFTDALVAIFNSENSALMARYAFTGMRIYFIGYLFAGFNIVSSGYLSAVNRPTEASITSISRGVVAIVACSLVLSALFGMNGVWAAFPASEAMTVALTLFLLQGKRAAD